MVDDSGSKCSLFFRFDIKSIFGFFVPFSNNTNAFRRNCNGIFLFCFSFSRRRRRSDEFNENHAHFPKKIKMKKKRIKCKTTQFDHKNGCRFPKIGQSNVVIHRSKKKKQKKRHPVFFLKFLFRFSNKTK